MKTIRTAIATATTGLISSQALATGFDWASIMELIRQWIQSFADNVQGSGGATAVPEINALNAGLAVALTGSLIAISREIRKARKH